MQGRSEKSQSNPCKFQYYKNAIWKDITLKSQTNWLTSIASLSLHVIGDE